MAASENKNNRLTRKQAIEQIERNISDKNLREMLFGTDINDDFLTNKRQILFYIWRIIIVSFHYMYFRYRKWQELTGGNNNSLSSSESIRMLDVMQKMYVANELSYGMIENILVDFQIEIGTSGQISEELDLKNEILQNRDLTKMISVAKKAIVDPRFNDDSHDINKRIDELMNFISKYAFLTKLKTELHRTNATFYEFGVKKENIMLQNMIWNDDTLFCSKKELHGEFKTYNCIVKVGGNYYYLTNVEFIMNNGEFISAGEVVESQRSSNIIGLKLNYESFSANSYLTIVVAEDEKEVLDYFVNDKIFFLQTDYQEYCEENFRSILESITSKPIFENFYTINYKYIKNLSLAVVDVLNKKEKNLIYNNYKTDPRFSILFNTAKGNSEISDERPLLLQWDTIIAILMVEEGASKLLQIIFRENDDLFKKLLGNLELRFGADIFCSEEIFIKTEGEIFREQNRIKQRNLLGGDKNGNLLFKREIESIKTECQVRATIVNVTRAVNGNQINEKIGFPLSIRSRIQLLENIRDDYGDNASQKIKKIRAIVNQTISTLIIFYRGLVKYTKQKMAFENESNYRILTDDEINRYQQNAQTAFDEEAKQYRNKIKEYEGDHIKIFEELKCLYNDFMPDKSSEYKVLKNTLGKQQLMDFNYITKLLNNCWNIKDLSQANNSDVNNIIVDVIAAFRYLQTGYKDKTFLDKELSLNAIFPFVATYQYAKQTGDGYHINNFSIISAKGQDVNIKVLSEFKYKLNEKYYCLPNKQRSAEKLNLWIEPILIMYEEDETNE